MITKEEEYMARSYQIAGFALIAPLGRFFLDPFSMLNGTGSPMFNIFIIVSLALAFTGLVFIDKGRDILKLKR